jgi:hypothetical protein
MYITKFVLQTSQILDFGAKKIYTDMLHIKTNFTFDMSYMLHGSVSYATYEGKNARWKSVLYVIWKILYNSFLNEIQVGETET